MHSTSNVDNRVSPVAEMLKVVDETVTAYPRVWSKAEDGIGAVLQQEDFTKADPIKHKLASYPSLGLSRVRYSVGEFDTDASGGR